MGNVSNKCFEAPLMRFPRAGGAGGRSNLFHYIYYHIAQLVVYVISEGVKYEIRDCLRQAGSCRRYGNDLHWVYFEFGREFYRG